MTHQTGVFRIGKDAELRTAGNTSVINLALASNYGKKGDDGKKPTQWIDAALWGKRAEALEQYLVKGQQVYCVLKDVHIETYEKRDSGTASKLVAEILDIELVGSSSSSGERSERERPRAEPRREERPRQQAPQRSTSFDDMDSDDIPF
jgi:single-strand DNA-binding protein